MRRSLWKFGLLGATVALLVVIILRQRAATSALQARADRLRSAAALLAKLEDEHSLLLARHPSPAEMAQLRENQSEAERLRAEHRELQAKLASTPPTAMTRKTPVEAKPATEVWTNGGNTTPETTFRTSVWAAVNGDTDALANLIAFDAAGRAVIEGQFARFSAEERQRYGTPEKVFATILAVQMPQDLVAAEPIATKEDTPNDHTIHLRMTRTNGTTKEADFRFQRDSDGWRLVVPTRIVESYTKLLAGAPPGK